MAYFYRIIDVMHSLGGLTSKMDHPLFNTQTSSLKEILRFLDEQYAAVATVLVLEQTRKHGKVVEEKELGYLGVFGQDFIRRNNGGQQTKSFPETWKLPVVMRRHDDCVVWLQCQINQQSVEGESRLVTNLDYQGFAVKDHVDFLYEEPWQIVGSVHALKDIVTNI